MKYFLEIFYQQKNVMPDYPMGDPEEFESLDDFLDFNYEQIDLIVDMCPEMKEVEQKLRNGEYEMHQEDDVMYVTVRNVLYIGRV